MDGPTFTDIEVRTELSAQDFVSDYLKPQRPVIIREGARNWPATQKWTPDWFASTYPEIKVPIAVGPRRRISRYEQMTLSQFVAEMKSSKEHMYLRQFDIFRLLPQLLQSLPHSIYCPTDRELVRNFWMGMNTIQPLHYDAHRRVLGTCNLFAQICGTKRIILASPQQTPFLYERTGEDLDYHLSQVDIEAPDLRRFPLVRKATLHTGEVTGGDLLFVPLNYWHFMQSLGASISVSFWWHPLEASHLAYQLLKLADDPQQALRFAQEHAGVVTRREIEELGGIDELRLGLRSVPDHVRNLLALLFDKDVQASLKAPVGHWFAR